MSTRALYQAALYGIFNTACAVSIVVVNKVLLTKLFFGFPVFLTLLHSMTTWGGMAVMAMLGVFKVKRLTYTSVLSLAVCYVVFIVSNNLSIKNNTVGFYQISKIMVTPTVVGIEIILYRKRISTSRVISVLVLLLGIMICTVYDKQVSSNPLGIAMASVAVFSSAIYQVWTGKKQVELDVSANQLVHQVVPASSVLLAFLTVLLEPLGFCSASRRDSVVGYPYSPYSLLIICLSCFLGFGVTLSAYLFIGATSPLTYNVIGHTRTILIVASGIAMFDEQLTIETTAGLFLAVAGIVAYTVCS
jgi:solute carrier family 35 protein E3